jgi:hypothetical protein
MSPPEVWGPAVWTLFHTIAEKINEENNTAVVQQVFGFIKRICAFLPCPECSKDAKSYLQRLKQSEIKTRSGLISTVYLFHNYVNRKKKKKLFNYGEIVKYRNMNLVKVFNQFIGAYNTKGNMQLIAESFQRQLIVADLKRWLSGNIHMFMPKPVINTPVIAALAEVPASVPESLPESVPATVEVQQVEIKLEPPVEESEVNCQI